MLRIYRLEWVFCIVLSLGYSKTAGEILHLSSLTVNIQKDGGKKRHFLLVVFSATRRTPRTEHSCRYFFFSPPSSFYLAVFRQCFFFFGKNRKKDGKKRNNLYKTLAHQKTRKQSDLDVSDASTHGGLFEKAWFWKAFDWAYILFIRDWRLH